MEKPVAGTLLPEEALDQTVVAPAAADRAEAHGLAVLVFDRKGQFGLEHGAGVVFEAAHDRGVDADAIFAIAAGAHELGDRIEFFETPR